MRKLLFMVLFFCGVATLAIAQQKTVTGTVTGADDGLTIIGATVQIKGTLTGVTTDLDGNYSINASEGDILVFRFVGMSVQEQVVGSSNTIDVVLEMDYMSLDEVVVVGYGTQIKSKVTGAISKVEGEDLRNTPVPSIELALQGKTAGVFVEAVNGKVSGATRMRIRGSASITADNQPLFVVDGVPLTTEALNYAGSDINPLTSINVNDIASVEILKDAASAAMYGSRGANGVVIITTKKGINGATKLNFNLQRGISSASNRREFLNAEEYVELFEEAAYNSDLIDGFDPINNPGDYPGSWLEWVRGRFDRYSGHSDWTTNETDTDWQDEIFRTGKTLATDLSAQGGNESLKYFASVGYNKLEGILKANDLEKISARLNIDNQVNSFTEFGFALSLNRTFINNVSDDNAFSTPMQLVAQAPITPPRDLNGELYNTPTTTYYNGLIDNEDATREVVEYRTVANTYLNFQLYEGLKLRNELGFDLYNMKENGRYGVKTNSGTGVNGYGFGNYGQTQNIATKSYLDYIKVTDDFSVSAVLGTEFIYTTVERLRAEGEQFPLDDLKTLASSGLITGATSTLTQYSFLSYFTRANIDYQSKYLLTLSARVDGSSRFGANQRYGFFPAASAGWVISKEDFLSDNNNLSYLKIRASFGLTGNAGIGNFSHLGLYGTNAYNSSSGLLPTQIPNEDLTWENTQQIDFGLDFGFFDNRISGEIDYYVKKTTDLLLDVPVPATSGYDIQTQNIGSIENRGVEFVINTYNTTGSLKWNTSFNIAYNKNEVTSLGDQTLIDPGSSRYMSVVQVGQPLGAFLGAEYAGVDPANGDALWYVNEEDANGDIVNPEATTNDFSSANFVILGTPNPDLIGAITNTFEYKGVELSFTFQGVYGNKIQMAGDGYMSANAEWFDNQTKSQLDRWQQPGDITDVPQARLAYGNGSETRSSRYLSDGAYLKLRSMTLSYNLPTNVVQKLGLDNMRIYMQGQNLLTFTKYEGWDPEVSADFLVSNIRSGIDFYSAPQPRTITFGISIGL